VTIPDQIVLILDDYHLIEAQSVHDALAFLLRRLPSPLHLVIATREDPPLPLARLRARGQLTGLRALDLRFTYSKAAEFLNQTNLLVVPLDGERRWYRNHHLFADLLRQRLRQNLPDQVSTLHHRASEWFEQNGFAERRWPVGS
jgi:ATP/maltotriose-dependent transcriptional regulator MalT